MGMVGKERGTRNEPRDEGRCKDKTEEEKTEGRWKKWRAIHKKKPGKTGYRPSGLSPSAKGEYRGSLLFHPASDHHQADQARPEEPGSGGNGNGSGNDKVL